MNEHSQFTTHDSRFTTHDSRLTTHDNVLMREKVRSHRRQRWDLDNDSGQPKTA